MVSLCRSLINPRTPQNNILDRLSHPNSPRARFYSPLIELPRHSSKRQSACNHVLYKGVDLASKGIRRLDVCTSRLPAIQAGISKLHASELGLGHCHLCPLGDHNPFVFGHGGEYVDREP